MSIALSNTFVNIYLWKQTGELKDIGLYNLAVAVAQPFTFILAGRWAKKIDRVIVFRIGITLLALFYLSVLAFGTSASKYLLLLGALLGMGYGFYWLAFNVLTFEITEPETRDFFNGFLGILLQSGGCWANSCRFYYFKIGETYWLFHCFWNLISTVCCCSIFKFFFKTKTSNGNYWLTRILLERKHNLNWRMVTNAHFFQGLREGIFAFMISVLSISFNWDGDGFRYIWTN